MSNKVDKSLETRRSFSEYKLEKIKLLRDALITNATGSVDLLAITPEPMSKSMTGLILPLVNIVDEYSLSLPNYKSISESSSGYSGDSCKKVLEYYFSGWQEIIDNFPDFVQQSIDEGNAGGAGIAKLTDILRSIATVLKTWKEIKENSNGDRICELAVYGLLGEEHSKYDQRSLCRQSFLPHLSPSVTQLCSGAFPYNRNIDANLTFWENLVPILWVRPGVDRVVGSPIIITAELLVRKQKVIHCISNYHNYHNFRCPPNSSHRRSATPDVDKANDQLILLVDHLLN